MAFLARGAGDRTRHLWYRDRENPWQYRRECRRAKAEQAGWRYDWKRITSLDRDSDAPVCPRCASNAGES